MYEKLRQGIWLYNGVFHLVDLCQEDDGDDRKVCEFKLARSMERTIGAVPRSPSRPEEDIPTSVELAVWQRDGGDCVVCGATNELHFDHDLPYSQGGASITENVQLISARHNLERGGKIV